MQITGQGRLALATAAILGLGVIGWMALRPSTDEAKASSPASERASRARPATSATTTAKTGAGWIGRENAKPGSTAWKIKPAALANDTQLAGYADHVSVFAGDPLRLFVTTTARSFTVGAFRLGWYGGDKARLVWQSSSVPGRRQVAAVTDSHRMVSTRWTPSTTVETRDWPEGTYLLLLTDSRGLKKYVPVTVRTKNVSGRLVLMNAVATYQAYNEWGGYSLYAGPGHSFGARSSMVSFDRPYDANGARVATQYEHPTIAEAERRDLPLAYLTSIEVDANPHALDGARGLVSMGHDEYWSVGMRRTVTTARNAGSNLAFLGANSLYWRVRFEPSAMGPRRVVVGYKSAANDPVKGATTTARWRDNPMPSAENSLLGMLYECFPAHGALVINDPSFFLLRGTGATKGARYAGLVGTEIDRAYPIPGTPDNLQVVAHSPVVCAQGRGTHADVTYYSTTSGAGVLAVGSMLWSTALRGPNARYGIGPRGVAFTRMVTANLLSAMAAGPMGKTHPARGNLAALNSPSSTASGTGGPLAP